jgi:outer membrane protein OmpA-like peptidoglycan-associated protein
VGIARAAQADRYAPNTFAKAQQLLEEAQQLDQSRADRSRVVQAAREASQTAEDARVISDRRRQDEQIAKAQAELNSAQQTRAQADAEVQQAKIRADAAQAQLEAERAARERAEQEAERARKNAAEVRAQAQVEVSQAQAQANTSLAIQQAQHQQEQAAADKAGLRMRMLEQMNGTLEARDTPRGLMVTIPGADFSSTQLQPAYFDHVASIAAIIAAHPGLRVEVEGHTDSTTTEPLSWKRAEAVRNVLLAHGLSANSVTSRGLGNSRPIASNATGLGREQNQRVEIIISGDPIGNLPFWDRTYSLSRR